MSKPLIITWSTWKQMNLSLPFTEAQETSLSGLRVVGPTLKWYGYKPIEWNDIFGDTRSPREILDEDFEHRIQDAKEVVYYIFNPSGNQKGLYKFLNIYWK